MAFGEPLDVRYDFTAADAVVTLLTQVVPERARAGSAWQTLVVYGLAPAEEA